MQCHTEAKRMADESVDDMAAEASIIPPSSSPLIQSDPPPHQFRLLKDNAPVTAPSQTKYDLTSQLPPPTLPKLQQQATPDPKRPDSAYGGSGGSPSLLSTVKRHHHCIGDTCKLLTKSVIHRNPLKFSQMTSLHHQILYYNHLPPILKPSLYPTSKISNANRIRQQMMTPTMTP